MQDMTQIASLDPADFTRVREAVVGLSVGKLARTHSSMFLLKLGRMATIQGLRRVRQRGEWELLVEAADWVLGMPEGSFVTCEESHATIDDAFASLCDTKVSGLDISKRGNLRLATVSGYVLQTRHAPPELAGMSRWTLFQNDTWCLVCRFDGTFEAGDPKAM